MSNAEQGRLAEAGTGVPWRRWGPYLSERQWGTVREHAGTGDHTWLFGLTNSQGNHGEDVKECYYYLDATPTNSYLKMRYLHPNGQLPAYEWNFSDVNPPVHAWATWFVRELGKRITGKGARAFLDSFYDVLRRPDGSSIPLKVRSVIGLMPLVAATVIDGGARAEFPRLVSTAVELMFRGSLLYDPGQVPAPRAGETMAAGAPSKVVAR